MSRHVAKLAIVSGMAVTALSLPCTDALASKEAVQLGPRPFYLVEQMVDGELKKDLEGCVERRKSYRKTEFSIGHRGAALQFPEHTRESYEAAARMGAGIVECDVAFTSDETLVCRHSQCDLHTTTDILVRPELAARCSVPFQPAAFDPLSGEMTRPASARCCTTDLTAEEFLSLRGKMDAFNPAATTPEEYLEGTANVRTGLHASAGSGTVMTHAQSIELFKALGVGMTPELKSGAFDRDGDGIVDVTQSDLALKMIDEYRDAGISPDHVWPQSFNYEDVLIWVKKRPDYATQAVFLDGRYGAVNTADPGTENLVPSMEQVAAAGVNIIAPPMWMLLTTHGGDIVASRYAKAATDAGLDIIAWTTERSGRIVEDVLAGGDRFYYQSTLDALVNDGDILTTIDALAQDVGAIGIFSDWPATTTFYANCKKVSKGGRYRRRGKGKGVDR